MKSAKQIFTAAVTPLVLSLAFSPLAVAGAADKSHPTPPKSKTGTYVLVDGALPESSGGSARQKRLLAGFEENTLNLSGKSLSHGISDIAPPATVLTLSGKNKDDKKDALLIPFNTCEVSYILNDAKKKKIPADFTQENWPNLRERLDKNGPASSDCAP